MQKEDFQDKIEQFKLTIKSLVQAFKNLTSKDPNTKSRERKCLKIKLNNLS